MCRVGVTRNRSSVRLRHPVMDLTHVLTKASRMRSGSVLGRAAASVVSAHRSQCGAEHARQGACLGYRAYCGLLLCFSSRSLNPGRCINRAAQARFFALRLRRVLERYLVGSGSPNSYDVALQTGVLAQVVGARVDIDMVAPLARRRLGRRLGYGPVDRWRGVSRASKKVALAERHAALNDRR